MATKYPSFIKNIRVSQKYGVSRPTVGKWVENAIAGKNNLQLTFQNGRKYIVDNRHNMAEIQRLKEHGVKYRNKVAFETVTPEDKFYKIFNTREIIDLTTSLEFNRTIPLKYSYYNKGAEHWSKYSNYVQKQANSNAKHASLLADSSKGYISYLLKDYRKINIIEIGPGNGSSAGKFITLFSNLEKDVSYTAVDISEKMLQIATQSISEVFTNIDIQTVKFDIEDDNLKQLLFNPGAEPDSCNLILFLNHSLGNAGSQKERINQLTKFRKAMSKNDYLLVDNTLDIMSRRTSFKRFENRDNHEMHLWLPHMIGLAKDSYTEEYIYDQNSNVKLFNIRLKKDVDIIFTINSTERVVKLVEGDQVTVWKHSSWKKDSVTYEFREAGLEPYNFAIDLSNSSAIVVAGRTSATPL